MAPSLVFADYLNFGSFFKARQLGITKLNYFYQNKFKWTDAFFLSLFKMVNIQPTKVEPAVGRYWLEASTKIERLIEHEIPNLNQKYIKFFGYSISMPFYDILAGCVFGYFAAKNIAAKTNFIFIMKKPPLGKVLIKELTGIAFYSNYFLDIGTRTNKNCKFEYIQHSSSLKTLFEFLILMAKCLFALLNYLVYLGVRRKRQIKNFYHINHILNPNREPHYFCENHGSVKFSNQRVVHTSSGAETTFFLIDFRDSLLLVKRIALFFWLVRIFGFGPAVRFGRVVVNGFIIAQTLVKYEAKLFFSDFESPENLFARKFLRRTDVLTVSSGYSWGFMYFKTRYGHWWKDSDINFVFNREHGKAFYSNGDSSVFQYIHGWRKPPKHWGSGKEEELEICVVDNSVGLDNYHNSEMLTVFLQNVVKIAENYASKIIIKAKKSDSDGDKVARKFNIPVIREQGSTNFNTRNTIFVGFGLTTVLQEAASWGCHVLVFDPFGYTPKTLKAAFHRIEIATNYSDIDLFLDKISSKAVLDGKATSKSYFAETDIIQSLRKLGIFKRSEEKREFLEKMFIKNTKNIVN